MTAARSAASQVRPCSRGERLTDLVPPDLGVDEDAVEVEDDRAVQVRPPPVAAAAAGLGGPASSRPVRALGRAPGRPTTVAGRLTVRPSIGGEQVEGEAGDGVGVVVGALEDLALHLEAQQAVATGDLHRQLAGLDPVPADELAGGARALLGDVDPDVDLEEAGVGRDRGGCSGRPGRRPTPPSTRDRRSAPIAVMTGSMTAMTLDVIESRCGVRASPVAEAHRRPPRGRGAPRSATCGRG